VLLSLVYRLVSYLPGLLAVPVRSDLSKDADLRSVRRKPVVAGLINEYHYAT
jgi:hypothetical protein